jgi:hypothetical protein
MIPARFGLTPLVVPLVLLLVLLPIGCKGAAAQALCTAGYTVCSVVAGPFCGTNTCRDNSGDDDDGSDPATQGPWYGPDSFNVTPESCGSAVQGYGDCVACITASPCCEGVLECVDDDEECTCQLAHRMGIKWPDGSCGPPDETWTTVAACMTENCATACPTGSP